MTTSTENLFSTQDIPASPEARSAAQEFWTALAQHEGVSAALRVAAAGMAGRMGQ